MTKIRVYSKRDEREVERIISRLPGILSGIYNDSYGVRRAFWGGFAHSLYRSIFRAYLHKSRLGPDELGNRWPDISPATKVKRLSKPNRSKRKPSLGLLNTKQKKFWWQMYRKHKALFLQKKRMPLKKAKAAAAKVAWSKVKKIGGKTKIGVFGNKKIPVMIDKRRLIESLAPGTFNGTHYTKRNTDQIFTVMRDRVILGTKVPYSAEHHSPKRRGLPQRRLYPESMGPWMTAAVFEGTLAVGRKLARVL